MHVMSHNRVSYKRPRGWCFSHSIPRLHPPACHRSRLFVDNQTLATSPNQPTSITNMSGRGKGGKVRSFLRPLERWRSVDLSLPSFFCDRVSERVVLSVTARFSVITSRVSLRLLTFDRAREVEVVTELSRLCGRGCLAATVVHFYPR